MPRFDYPLPAFCFSVSLDGSTGDTIRFQEVSGLEFRLETEQYKAGGENNIIYQLPVRTTYQNVVLKRGIFDKNDPFLTWIKACLLEETNIADNFGDRLKTVQISLLNPSDRDEALFIWKLENAFPVKWNIGNFNSQQNSIAVESIELVYQKITIE